MDVTKILAFAVASAVCAALLRRTRPEFSLAAGTLAAAAVVAAAIKAASPVWTMLRTFASVVPDGETYLACLLKATGAVILSGAAADVCADCGETALARAATLTGRAAVIIAALPVFKDLFETATALMRL